MESVGSYRYQHKPNRTRHHIWIRQDVTPAHDQGRYEFYACGEAYCAMRWGPPEHGQAHNYIWSKHGSSFFFKNYNDMVDFVHRMQQGFTPREAKVLMLKRKLILGNLIDKHGESII